MIHSNQQDPRTRQGLNGLIHLLQLLKRQTANESIIQHAERQAESSSKAIDQFTPTLLALDLDALRVRTSSDIAGQDTAAETLPNDIVDDLWRIMSNLPVQIKFVASVLEGMEADNLISRSELIALQELVERIKGDD